MPSDWDLFPEGGWHRMRCDVTYIRAHLAMALLSMLYITASVILVCVRPATWIIMRVDAFVGHLHERLRLASEEMYREL